jgi:hypothetical protein
MGKNLFAEIFFIALLFIVVFWSFFEYIGYIPQDDGILHIIDPYQNFREDIKIEQKYKSEREFPKFVQIKNNNNYQDFVNNWDTENDVSFVKNINMDKDAIYSRYIELNKDQFSNLLNLTVSKINNRYNLAYNIDNFDTMYRTINFKKIYNYKGIGVEKSINISKNNLPKSNTYFVDNVILHRNILHKFITANILGALNNALLKSNYNSEYHKFIPYKLIKSKIIDIYKSNSTNIVVLKIIYNVGRNYRSNNFNFTSHVLLEGLTNSLLSNITTGLINILDVKLRVKFNLNGMPLDKIISNNINYKLDNRPEQKQIFNKSTSLIDKITNLNNKNNSKLVNDDFFGFLENNREKLNIELAKYDKINNNVLKQIEKNKANDVRHEYKCFHPKARDSIIEVDNEIHCISKHSKFDNNIGIWDKPCSNNTDCPYYKANKNYDNNFGGCKNDKTCEMPIGVTKIGYTKILRGSEPLCHGCLDINSNKCCEEQYDKSKYPNLKSPDYMFESDYKIRN